MQQKIILIAGAVVVVAAAWGATIPARVPAADLAGLSGDATKGEAVFHAAGCASCHMAPGAVGDDQLVLKGGMRFDSPFGTFIAPNITPSPAGIGGWTVEEFVTAVAKGASPDGQHYYPAFPYNSYNKAELSDLVDLKAFMDTLPQDMTPSAAHEVGFPFNIRQGMTVWKLLYEDKNWTLTGDLTPEEERGRYLAEALGHCAECHTPRDGLGGFDRSRWMAGAASTDGSGRIPGITPAQLDWSADEITEYLTSGFTPDYDSAGGHMAHVVENYARLPEADRAAVATYVKRLAPAE